MPVNLLSLLGGLAPGMQARDQMMMQQQGQSFGQAATLAQLAAARQQAMQQADQKRIENEIANRRLLLDTREARLRGEDLALRRLIAERDSGKTANEMQLREQFKADLQSTQAELGPNARPQDVISALVYRHMPKYVGTPIWDDLNSRYPELSAGTEQAVYEKLSRDIFIYLYGGSPDSVDPLGFSQWGLKSYEDYREQFHPVIERAMELYRQGGVTYDEIIRQAYIDAREFEAQRDHGGEAGGVGTPESYFDKFYKRRSGESAIGGQR